MANIRVSVPQSVTVDRVTDEHGAGYRGYSLWLSCGHILPMDDDETHKSLVGAETTCNRHFEWREDSNA